MKTNPPTTLASNSKGSHGWFSSRLLIVIVGISAIALLFLWVLHGFSSKRLPREAAVPIPTAGATDTQSAVHPAARSQSKVSPPRSPRPDLAEPKQAGEIISRLLQMDLSGGVITREEAAEINAALKRIAALGSQAVPAIRDFLAQNTDVNYADLQGANLLDNSSLRIGLLNALRRIGGPEALELSLQTLQSTGEPREIAILARNLEQQYPGQYRQATVAAARDALAQLAGNPTAGRDVAPLFQLLQSYGDASVVPDVLARAQQWERYAMLTLAGLPDGQGIPALIRQVQDAVSVRDTRGQAAIQALAQVSVEYPDAAAALVQKAAGGKMAAADWNAIAATLAGTRYEFGTPAVDNPATLGPIPATRQHFSNPSSLQSFYTTKFSDALLGDQAPQRIGLVDQLIAANPGQAAVQALQGARSQLVTSQQRFASQAQMP